MKRIFFHTLMLFSIITFTCSTIWGQPIQSENKIEYIPVRESSRGAWSMIGPDGRLLFNQLYLEDPTVVMNGLFSVGGKNNFTVFKAGASPTVFEGCKDLYSVGALSHGNIPICKKGQRIQLVSPTGKMGTLNPVKGNEIIETGTYFCEGLLPIRNEKLKWGFMDISGRVIVQPIYDKVSYYSCGRALAKINSPKKDDYSYGENNEPDRYFILDKEGQKVCELPRFISPRWRHQDETYYDYSYRLDWLPPFQDGVLLVMNEDGMYSFVDINGQMKKLPNSLSQSIFYINDYNSKYIVGEYAIYSMSNFQELYRGGGLGKYISPWNTSNVITMGNYVFYACQLITATGSVLKTYPKGEKLYPLSIYYPVSCGDFAFVERNNNYYKFCNKNGIALNNTEFIAFGKNIAPNSTVKSDYFPAQTIAEYLNKMITSEGLGRYKIGHSFPGPVANDKLISFNYFKDDEIDRKTLYYSLEFVGHSYDNILDESGNIIPDSEIEALVMKLTLNDEWGNKYKDYRTENNYKGIVTSLVKLLKNRGFEIVANSRYFSGRPSYVSANDDTVLLNNGKIYINIYPCYGLLDEIVVSVFSSNSTY